MILVGNQRGGAKKLANHLLKEENDHVVMQEVPGFASTDLSGAPQESYALSRATKCKQQLFSLSLNPPPSENVPTEHFERTIAQIEQHPNVTSQPRAIVFHEKEGPPWSLSVARKKCRRGHTERSLFRMMRMTFF